MVADVPRHAPTAVVITALELEAVAVREHLTDVNEDVHSSGTVYCVGRFADEAHEWRVAIVVAGPGNPTAAIEAERAAQHFKPAVVLLVGIAGALKDLTLGDVVAADKVYGYERGKAETEFHSRPDIWRSTYPAIQRARTEVTSAEWQNRILGERPRSIPKAVVAPIAAGEKVVAAHNSPTFQFLRTSFSDAVAVEMEGAGFLAAAHSNIWLNALVVRGISDLIEGKASADAGGSQMRAARHAAAFAFQLLSKLEPGSSGRTWRDLREREDQLERLFRESRARCIERWQGAGLPAASASTFADDDSIGIPGYTLRPSRERPMTVLVGEFGLGKSLACERLYQHALRRSSEDPNAPAPVHVELSPGKLPSLADLRALAAPIGDVDKVGITLFLERSDEAGQEHAVDCLGLGRRVIANWPGSTVVMPTRPLPHFVDIPEAIAFPLMAPAQAAELIARVSGSPFDEHDLWRWQGSLADAVRRPLFAILVGLYLRGEHTEYHYPSAGELIGAVVLQALRRGRIDVAGATKVLQRLAVSTIDHGGEPVHYRTVGGLFELDALSSTGLIVQRGDSIGFAVPIVAQWFAAQAIARDEVDVLSIVLDKRRSGAWRYPFSIVAASAHGETMHEMMRLLASNDPALAAVVLKDAVGETFRDHHGTEGGTVAPEVRLQVAWRSWVTGLGNLALAAGPVGVAGSPYSVRTRVEGAELIVEWFDVPAGGISAPRLVHSLRLSTGNRGEAWPWQLPLQHMKRELADCLRHLCLPIDEQDPLAIEAIWAGSLALTGRSSLHPGPVRLSEIAAALEALNSRARTIRCYDRGHVPLTLITLAVQQLAAAGATELHSPFPTGDIEKPTDTWVWSPFSETRLLERTRAIYELAIAGYSHLVQRWFSNFADRLAHAVILPARFIATLEPAVPPKEGGKSPGLHYRFEPLLVGSASHVDIVLGSRSGLDDRRVEVARWAAVQKIRPDASQWIPSLSGSTVLEVFGSCPATKIAYKWLEYDLRQIHWA
jgi:nucleoside phosphorylase